MTEHIITKESSLFKTDTFIARAILELGAQVTLIKPDPETKPQDDKAVQQ
jgi:phosphopantothenoylcysteine synthetase/decarboxylase